MSTPQCLTGRRFFSVLLLLAVAPILQAEDSVVGRFQIIAATVYSEASKTDVKMVFKLDTATGKTWFWDNLPMKGKDGNTVYIPGWAEATADVTQQYLDIHNARVEKAKTK